MKKANAIVILLALLVGCAAVSEALNDNTLLAGVAAYKATGAVIERAEDPAERAKRIIGYTEVAARMITEDTPTNIDSLYQTIRSLVLAQVPSVDRQPAEDFLLALRDELIKQIGEFNVLTPETEVTVLHIIERIRMAAEYYAQS